MEIHSSMFLAITHTPCDTPDTLKEAVTRIFVMINAPFNDTDLRWNASIMCDTKLWVYRFPRRAAGVALTDLNLK